jgi:isochorismate pyruvate lyase
MTAQSVPEMAKDPTHCMTMAEVRTGVDQLDAEIVALLARRFAYMGAAARIKDDRNSVRDEVRKAQVIANARRAAWETLVEGSIAYEYDRWDALRG